MNIPRFIRLASPVALLAALPATLDAQALEQALKNFSAAPAVSAPAVADSAYTGSLLREWDSAQGQIVSLNSYIDGNDFNNALSQARNYARAARTPEVRKLWDDLVAALQSEAKARETAFVEKVDDVFARVGKAALSATKAAELDGLLDELYLLQEARNRSYNNRHQRVYTRIDNTLGFVNSWQDYLAFRESGEIENARNTLRNLNSSGHRYRPVSRSDILKLIATLNEPPSSLNPDLLAGATLDNLRDIRARVAAEQQTASGLRASELSSLMSDLSQISRAVAELKLGRIASGSNSMPGTGTPPHPYQEVIQKLKNEWYFMALPGLTGLSDLGAPAQGETALSYLRRLVDEAVKAEDWPRARRLARVERELAPNEPYGAARELLIGGNPVSAITAWTNAQRLERAAQPAAAAALYREALKIGAPPKLEAQIIDRLRALAAEFPDSAKEAR